MSLAQTETAPNCVYLQAPASILPALRAGRHLALINPRQFQTLGLSTSVRFSEAQVAPGYSALLASLGIRRSAAQLRMSAAKSAARLSTARVVNADVAALQVEINGARLMQVGNMSLPAAMALQLLQRLHSLFASYDIELIEIEPLSYCLRIPDTMDLPQAAEPDAVIGMDMKAELPTPMLWQKILNDVQIELAELNSLLGGVLPFNSLWFWGTEMQSKANQSALAIQVQSSDPILNAFGNAQPNDQESIRLTDFRYTAAPTYSADIDWYWCSDGRVLQVAKPWWQRLTHALFGSRNSEGQSS